MELPAYEQLLEDEPEQTGHGGRQRGVGRPGTMMDTSVDGMRWPSTSNDSWGHPSNLDYFFTNMYTFYYHRGFASILLTQMCSIITLAFTAAFSSFLIAFVDWEALFSCNSEDTCEDFEAYVIKNPFLVPSFYSFLSMLYILISGVYWLWSAVCSVQVIIQAMEMEKFYREILHIEVDDETSWNHILCTLIHLHETRTHRVAVKEKLTEHDVVSRIMRKENFMIAFINKEILDIRLPWWVSPFIGQGNLFLTQSLEWSIHFCILQHMFDDQFRVSKIFRKDVMGLKLRLLVMGSVHLILLPFMVVFMTINFFLQNATDFHSQKAYLGPRKWSPFAVWKFREFNELPHIFEERMTQSLEPAIKYVSLFHNPLMAIIARCMAYISGSFVAILLLTSIFEQGAFLFVKVADHNLLWHLGLFSAMFAGARTLIPDENTTKKSAQELVEQFSSHTHYFPDHWKGQEHKITIKEEVADLFPVKTTLFGLEMLSVILTPIVLCFSLPNSVTKILEFISKHAVYVEGVGDVCDYSLFNFEDYGDQEFGTEVEGTEGTPHKLKDGKLEKSIINFHLAHPQWNATEGGKSLMARLKNYKEVTTQNTNEMMASLLEKSIMGGSTFSTVDGVGAGAVNVNADAGGVATATATATATSTATNNNTNINTNTTTSPADVPPGNQQKEQASQAIPPKPHLTPMSASVSASSPLKELFLSLPRGMMNKSTGGQQSLSAAFSSYPASPPQPGASSSIMANLPSVLMSILKEENIDYKNDFYWLTKFQQQRRTDPVLFENSLQLSLMMGSNIEYSPFSSSLNIGGLQAGPDRSTLVSPKGTSFTSQTFNQQQQQQQQYQQQHSPMRKDKEATVPVANSIKNNKSNNNNKNNGSDSGNQGHIAEL